MTPREQRRLEIRIRELLETMLGDTLAGNVETVHEYGKHKGKIYYMAGNRFGSVEPKTGMPITDVVHFGTSPQYTDSGIQTTSIPAHMADQIDREDLINPIERNPRYRAVSPAEIKRMVENDTFVYSPTDRIPMDSGLHKQKYGWAVDERAKIPGTIGTPIGWADDLAYAEEALSEEVKQRIRATQVRKMQMLFNRKPMMIMPPDPLFNPGGMWRSGKSLLPMLLALAAGGAIGSAAQSES